MNVFSRLKIFLPRAFVPAVVLLVLAGCTMIPKYHRPAPNISQSWPSVPGYAKTATTNATVMAADIGWQDFFRDPRLQQVITIALTNNPDLVAAVQNVEQNRYLYHVQADALIPVVSANGSASRQKVPNVFIGNSTNGGTAQSIIYNEFQANLGVMSYEIDLFGRVRSLKRQALETYFASEAARKSAQIALVAQVGMAYLTEEEATEELAVSREMLKAAHQTYNLTKQSFDAGVLSQFDLNTASTQLQGATAAVSGYAQQLAEASDNLTFLAGGPVPPNLAPSQKFNPNFCLADIPDGLPSDLLERRPDIIEAEHQLKADNANIGAARAVFFPTITLTGNAGYASTRLESLFVPGATAWGIEPQLEWPIFASGTAYHELKAVEAAQRAQAATYQSTVQNAFREVADALAVRQTVQSQLTDNEALVQADEQSYRLTKAGFDSGINSALDMNVTLQTLDSARLNLIQAQYSREVSLINLYQALGGGWTPQTVQTAQAAQK